MDGLLGPIRRMNAGGDAAGLVGVLCRLTPSRERVAGLPQADCLAVMRDLGVALGSLKRWGVEPVSAVPELGGRLVELGARTGMVPRDTVFHYSGWNPVGARERTYTGHSMERSLISGVRTTLPPLVDTIELCRRLGELDPCEAEFADTVTELASSIQSVVRAIDGVTASVTAEFFARTLRPYFAEISVEGTDYLGPAAAHIPLYLLGLALWASDHGGDAYPEFWRCSMRYGLPSWQQLAARLSRCGHRTRHLLPDLLGGG
jgi:monodechloroaminopyrrolnitrin synthase